MKATSKGSRKAGTVISGKLTRRPGKGDIEVINPISDGIVCIGNDWRYTYMNDAALRTHPLGRDGTLGKSIWDVHPEMKGTIFWDKYHEAMETRQVIEIESHYAPMNTWFFAKVYPSVDGLTILFMDISIRKRAEMDAEKAVQGVWVNVRDITERCKAEWEFKQSELRYRSVVEQLSEAVFVTDDHGNYIEVNSSACRLLGYTQEELLTKNARDILYSVDKINNLPDRYSYIRDHKSDVSENQLKRKDGSPVDVEANSAILPDGNFVSIVRDITERKRALKTLDTREKRFRAMVENSNDIIALLDREYRPIYRSPSAERVSGYSLEESVINAGFDRIHPDDKLLMQQQIQVVLSTEAIPITVEFRETHKQGHYIWLEGTMTNMFHDKDVNAMVVNLRDVTIPKLAREQLRANERRFRALIENITDGIVLNDGQFNVLFQSASVERILGYNLEERQSRNVQAIVHPDNLDDFAQLYKVLGENPGKSRPFQYRFLHKAGHYIWLEGVVTNLLHEPGINAYVANYRDITERKGAEAHSKRTELELRQSNSFLESAQRAGKIGYWISELTDEGSLIWSKETCHIFGIRQDDFDHRLETFYQIIHPDDREAVKVAAAYAIEHRRPYSIDHRIMLPDGTQKWVHEQGEVSFDNLGKTSQLIGIVGDITARKKAEQEILMLNAELEQRVKIRTLQLQEANKEMEAFTYSVSHDLRSPLRIINGYSQILLEDYFPKLDETGKKTLEIITSNALKMGRLIDDLLEFSKVGKTVVKKVEVDMFEIVREVISDLRMANVAIPENIFIGPLGTSSCDANLIKLVWMNLISNAIKYSGGGVKTPAVEIGTQRQEGKLVYYVKDNGAGFDMKYYNKLFGVFQRLHNQKEFAGTGVGLAIVQRIIVRHGGKVWAQATVDGGATFFFTVPC